MLLWLCRWLARVLFGLSNRCLCTSMLKILRLELVCISQLRMRLLLRAIRMGQRKTWLGYVVQVLMFLMLLTLLQVESDADYIELMSQWTRPRKEVDCEGPIKRIQCIHEQVRREARRKLGLPITRESATLSKFVKKVRGAIEEELGTPISTIAPVAPQLVGWGSEDFQDALDLAGLTSTGPGDRFPNNKLIYWDTNAAFAGLGYGLCKSWTNPTECMMEGAQMPYEHVLFLNFDNSSFSATVQYMQHVHQEWTYSNKVDMELGWWNLPVFEVAKAQFWAQIHEIILEVAGALQRAPNKVIVMGDHGVNAEFLDVVKAAMWDVLEIDVSLMISATKIENVGMLAARGAADLARRAGVWRKWKAGQEYDESTEL